jgi:hypothetical protein
MLRSLEDVDMRPAERRTEQLQETDLCQQFVLNLGREGVVFALELGRELNDPPAAPEYVTGAI